MAIEPSSGRIIFVRSFFASPEIVAVAVGAIISVLIVDRWRGLEGQVREIQNGQLEAIEKINDRAEKVIEQQNPEDLEQGR